MGNVPRSLVVVLEDDLADSCKSGEKITVKFCLLTMSSLHTDLFMSDVELNYLSDQFKCQIIKCFLLPTWISVE